MRSPQIQEQPFIFRGNDFVTPVMRFCFIANVAPEKHKGVAMVAISGDDLRNCVSTGNQDGQEQCDCAPSIKARANCSSTEAFPICAAKSKQSGGTIGKILSTRFDGISDMTSKPPKVQQINQKVSADISRNAAPIFHRRERRWRIAIAIISTLHGANL